MASVAQFPYGSSHAILRRRRLATPAGSEEDDCNVTSTPAAVPLVEPPAGELSAQDARRFMLALCLASVAGPMNFAMLAVALP
jgi:hypothetical protein